MNNILCGQTVPFRYFCLPGFAATQSPALREKLRPCRAVDGPVHSPAAQQGRICRIYNSICFLLCNISLNNKNFHGKASLQNIACVAVDHPHINDVCHNQWDYQFKYSFQRDTDNTADQMFPIFFKIYQKTF